MTKHVPYKPEHAKAIIEYGATGFCDATNEQINSLAEFKLNGVAFTCLQGDVPVSCGGFEMMWTGVAQAWFLCVKDINAMVTRENKRKFHEIVKENGLWRVQAPLRSDFETGEKFAEYMGFELEFVMKKYNPDGTDALMYVLGEI